VLARSGRLWLNTQFNHPAELTQASRRACARLVEAGIPVGNQSVLLKGVNDDPQVMERLVRGLVAMRVRPYYLFLCEPVRGVGHLRTSVARGLAILEHLRGRVSGLAIPTLAVDLPGGAGKVALTPQAVERREGDTLWFRSWRGDLVPYPDPPEP
jgi:lysine 2,3-aminomutase